MQTNKSKRTEWISPNNKYIVVGHKFDDELISNVLVKIKGRRSPVKYSQYSIKKLPLPQYIIDQCERIKFTLEN